MNIKQYIHDIGSQAREASRKMAGASSDAKNTALKKIAGIILEREEKLLKANQADLKAARENGLDTTMIERLELTTARITAMADGLLQVAGLEDPIGKISDYNNVPAASKWGRCGSRSASYSLSMKHDPT